MVTAKQQSRAVIDTATADLFLYYG